MKRLFAFFTMAVLVGATAFADSTAKKPVYKNAKAPIEERVNDLLSRMTLQEKAMQLSQYFIGSNDNDNNVGENLKKIPAEVGSMIYFDYDPIYRNAVQKKAMEESRLGIPVLFGYDVIHGYRTIYPIGLAQACSFNPELTTNAAAAAAKEARASGIEWTFSPMIDVAHDARWGRISEGFGEDPYTTGRFAVAAVKGFQGDDLSDKNHVAACLKHFIGYGASEGGRDYVYTEISPVTLWNLYIPPYEAGVKAGAATLMSSFNDISGTPATVNHYILTEVLKNRWKHKGFVVSDWGDIEQTIAQGYSQDVKEASEMAMNAGTDMDMMSHGYDKYLKELVEEGKVSMERVDDAVRRVLTLKFQLGLFEDPYTKVVPEEERFLQPDAKIASQRLAEETMVLLKNEGDVLPLMNEMGKKIAVVGPFAEEKESLIGNWHAHGRPDPVETIFNSLKSLLSGCTLKVTQGCDIDGESKDNFEEVRQLSEWADVTVVCLGEYFQWSGENCSRASIKLPDGQEQLVAEAKKAGKPVIVVVSNGRPIELPRIEKYADAIVEMWQPGTMGGPAVANILTGKVNPSGKLSVTFPYSVGQTPIYYNMRKPARSGDQGRYQDVPEAPFYPFGYGLSYTQFEYGKLNVSKTTFHRGDKLTASIEVKNVGPRDGKETVLFFIADPYCKTVTRPVKELKYFDKQLIPSGESRTYTFEIDPERDFGFYDNDGQRFLEKGEYDIIVGDQTVKLMLEE